MFLIKVAVKYGGDLIDPKRVWNLTTSLVQHFRSLPTGRWHLANLMAPGLEKMASTLGPTGEGQLQPRRDNSVVPDGAEGNIDPMMVGTGMDPSLIGMEGGLFFDYDMSFGLSPVFRFDAGALGSEGQLPAGTQNFQEVDYRAQGHPS